MSKTLKTVAVIAGAVALVATGVGAAAGIGVLGNTVQAAMLASTVGSVASAASAIGFAASIGAQVTAKAPPARGTVNQVIISPDPPAPYIIGRTYSGGVLRHDVGYGATLKKVPNPYRGQVIEYSVAGPCHALEDVYTDYAAVPFSGTGAASGYYAGFLYRDYRRGLDGEAALAPHWPGMPGWSAAHKLSSKAAILFNGLFDKDGKRFASGWPATGAVWQGVMTYDARQDSTYPGGSGAHRINDESTWSYSEDPGRHALAYALGRFRNGKKVFGIGLPVDGIVVEHFVDLSNICAANNWTVGGAIYEPGDRWANLKRILAAGGAEPLFIGGKLGLRINAPRVSIYELTAHDLAEDDAEIPAAKTWRERRNGIRPKYRSEANKWEYVPSDLVSIPAYIEEDGEEKFEEQQWDLVQNKDQVAQLAAYRLVNGREIGPINLVCKPHMRRFGPGDMITLQLGADHALGGFDAVILKRSVDPSTMKVSLTLETETAGKHDFALGRTGTAPPSPALIAREDKDVIAASVIETDVSWTDVIDDDPIHPKPEDGATVGATPEERDKLDQLEIATAQAAIDIAAAEAQIQDIIDSGVEPPDLTELYASVDALEADAAGLHTSLTSVQGTITDIQGSVSDITGDVATLATNLSTANANIALNATAITGVQGSVASLSSTVSAQAASISTNATAISTVQGNLAALTTELRAGSNPNLLKNGSAEMGNFNYWNSGAGFWTVATGNQWGSYFYLTDQTSGPDRYWHLISNLYQINENTPLTVTAGFDISSHNGLAQGYIEVRFYGASGLIANPSGGRVYAQVGFISDATTRQTVKATFSAPPGTTGFTVLPVILVPDGDTLSSGAFRQVKAEIGSIATSYSADASIMQTFTALQSLDTSFASLSTNVSSLNGSVSTLQSSMTNAQGSISTLQSTVASQGGSISSNATAISTLSGTVSTLSSTVSAQGSSISTLQSAQSTAAGNIATLQTQVTAGGGNLLFNTDLATGLEGWDYGTNGRAFHTFGVNIAGADWHPAEDNSLSIHQNSADPNGTSEYAQYVSVQAGKYYDFSVLCAGHRCYLETIAQWFNAGGGTIDSNSQGAFPPGGGGLTLNDYAMRSFTVVAPPGATRVRFYLRKYGTNSGGDSYAWFIRPQVTETLPTSASPKAYSPGSAKASVSSLLSAISTANGQIASLSSTVSTQGSTISSQATAISSLQGTQASLSSTVSSHGSSISTLQTATSTNAGNVATLITQVTANSPNLLRNGGFEIGNLNYWNAVGTTFSVNTSTDVWGVYAGSGVDSPDGSYAYLDSNQVAIERDWYTLTADFGYFMSSGSGAAYLAMVWWNGSSAIGETTGAQRGSGFNFSADGFTRRYCQATGLAPEGTTHVSARIVWYKASGSVSSRHVRQVKLERGQVATPYSSEASIVTSYQTLNTLTTQYASLSSTVSTLGVTVSTSSTAISTLSGNVATLFGQYVLDVNVGGVVTGMKLANNGSATSIKFQSDLIEFVGSTTGGRGEFRGGTWFGYDDNNRKRYQLGNQALA